MTLMMVVFVCSQAVCLSKWPTYAQCCIFRFAFAMQVEFQAWDDFPTWHCGRLCRERSLIVERSPHAVFRC